MSSVRKRRLKRVAMAAASLCALAAAYVYVGSEARLRAHYDVKAPPITVPNDYASIARGEHVVRALAKCTGCHGDDLGGGVVVDNPLAGRLSAPNLTSGPIVRRTDDELLRALVHGVAPDGRPLVLMPAHEIGQLGDEDLGAIVAYLRTVAPVAREVPPLRVGPAIRVKLAMNRLDILPAARIDHDMPRTSAPVAEATAAYGEYLAKTGGCYGCHGPTLAGGPIPGMPPGMRPAADIRPRALAAWSFADFDRALRLGIRPDGAQLAELMPWRATARMTDTEMRALYLYLKGDPSAAKSASNR